MNQENVDIATAFINLVAREYKLDETVGACYLVSLVSTRFAMMDESVRAFTLAEIQCSFCEMMGKKFESAKDYLEFVKEKRKEEEC
jgi:hypothetical protein